MDFVKNDPVLKSADLRKALGIAPATMSDIFKKRNVNFAGSPSRQGASKCVEPASVRDVVISRGFLYPKSAEIISFMICKGGTGKSTSTYFTGHRLVSYGAKVLLIDADPQGNLTGAFHLEDYGHEIDSSTPILVDVISGDMDITDTIIHVSPNLHLLPSTPMNSILDSKIHEKHKNPSLALKKYIEPLLNEYDYILVDCAPALNVTNTAMVAASNRVILPVNPDNFSQMGMDQTLQEIKTIREDFSLNDIKVQILFTKFDAREYTSLRYLSEISTNQEELLFNTIIRTSSDVKNSITKGEDLFSYSKSNAKEDYDSFTKELMGLQPIKNGRSKIK